MNPQKLYLGDEFSPSMLKHPYVSPLFAEHFEHLPPIMVQSGGCESLRDEIEALHQKINQSKTSFIHNEVYQVSLSLSLYVVPHSHLSLGYGSCVPSIPSWKIGRRSHCKYRLVGKTGGINDFQVSSQASASCIIYILGGSSKRPDPVKPSKAGYPSSASIWATPSQYPRLGYTLYGSITPFLYIYPLLKTRGT